LNAPPKALSAAQSRRQRELLSAALAEISEDWENSKHSAANDQPVNQQSKSTNETTLD
jgi:hypothetical protein